MLVHFMSSSIWDYIVGSQNRNPFSARNNQIQIPPFYFILFVSSFSGFAVSLFSTEVWSFYRSPQWHFFMSACPWMHQQYSSCTKALALHIENVVMKIKKWQRWLMIHKADILWTRCLPKPNHIVSKVQRKTSLVQFTWSCTILVCSKLTSRHAAEISFQADV